MSAETTKVGSPKIILEFHLRCRNLTGILAIEIKLISENIMINKYPLHRGLYSMIGGSGSSCGSDVDVTGTVDSPIPPSFVGSFPCTLCFCLCFCFCSSEEVIGGDKDDDDTDIDSDTDDDDDDGDDDDDDDGCGVFDDDICVWVFFLFVLP